MSFRKFKKVMAANRGEIAIRIFRACSEMDMRTVAIYTEQDKLSLHRYKADEAYLIGEGKGPIEAYLDIDEIIALAVKQNVDAIHPGYGFLSENPEFAEACEKAGIAFIGPDADIQRALGNKVAAREVALKANVPVVPGTDDPVESTDEALEFAKGSGFPIIIKAAAGGGGRGMRVARNEEELVEGFNSATSEAKAAFGDATVFLEKYLEKPKHIEVQILGDKHGNIVHFFERDCSIQRRHQKVIEIAPSVELSEEKREEICAYALQVAKEVGYFNAGTVEFLMDNDHKFYFIEVNPRIQVEHTVTELITMRDLVKNQIRVAQGYPLTHPVIGIHGQDDIEMFGYAIQCRVTTEDPSNNFLPDLGKIEAYRSPAGMGVRLDAGNAYAGARVCPHYDSLLVKISTFSRDFVDAAHIMDRALREFRIRGVKTNIGFLENVVTHPTFLGGQCDTSFIDAHPELFQLPQRKDRATKLLSYIGHTIINGYPGIEPEARLHLKDLRAPEIPEVACGTQPPAGSRDIFKEKGAEGLSQWVLEQKPVLLTDTTMRDAHQSLMATRIRTFDLDRIAEATAHLGAGLFSLEMWGGATFDVSMRFLKEDPWERLDRLREKIPNILFQMLLRGSNAVGYCNYPDNVVQEFVAQAAKSGIDIFRVFDALNWTKSMAIAMEAVRKNDAICEATICYTGDILDPKRDKYTLKYYVDLAKELESMGAHMLAIKDMAGLLKPFAAQTLVTALKEEVGIPIHFHTHDTSSNAGASLLMATEADVDIVDVALSSMSGLTSQANMNGFVATLDGHERKPDVHQDNLQQLANYWETVRSYYKPFETELNAGTAQVYHHEIPGGQYSNYKPQVVALGLGDQWEECKAMYRKVNDMFGDIIKVTPTSKVVGDMAIFMVKNGLQPEDVYEKGAELTFPQSVIDLFRGMMGQPYGGFPEKLQKVILKDIKPITHRPGEELPPVDLQQVRDDLTQKFGSAPCEREVLSSVLYPAVYDEFNKERIKYSDTSLIPTPVFFYGMEPGDQVSFDIEPGKTLILRLNNVGKAKQNGERTIYFELNGQPRSVVVVDQSKVVDTATHEKADPFNPHHVGAPMPGKVLSVFAKVGDSVEEGDILFTTEAMKMEANVKTKIAGKVTEVLVSEGSEVGQGELLAVID